MRRIEAGQVRWYRAASPAELGTLLRRDRPSGEGAHAIELGERRFVFWGPSFKALWKQAAEADFSPEAIERLLRSGEEAVAAAPGERPYQAAYDPYSGAVWVREPTRSALPSPLFDAFPRADSPSHFERREAARAPVRRTPHIDVLAEGELGPGARFAVEVYCDCSLPAPEEEVVEIALELPADWSEEKLGVWLVLPPQLEAAEQVGAVILRREEGESTRLRFELSVAETAPVEPVRISAVFSYGGRPCGQVTRTLAIGTAGEPAPEERPRPPRLVVHPDAVPADLRIEIKATGEDEQEFECRVLTSLLPDRDDPAPTKWRLGSRAPDLVNGFMEGFTEDGLDDGERVSRLRGAGMKLWKAAPREVQEVFWKLVDAGTPPRSIFVVTDEWSFPWELVVPVRGAGPGMEQRDPWGTEFPLGRWVDGEMISPPQRLEIRDSYVFAPAYTGERALPKVPAEARYVCENLNGEEIKPGDFQPLEESFATRGVSLAHFACHASTTPQQVQAIDLENGNLLRSDQIAAMPALTGAMAKERPLVFLNACEAGRALPSLVGVGGFGTEFVDAGATCVIAPLWSVDDGIAHELAIAFYDELRAGSGVLAAAVLQGLRAKAYAPGGADSWAAYSFYGDPLTQIEVSMQNPERTVS